jgi:hypothetical protein
VNRKELVTESGADEVPDFDPAEFVYGDPARFTADTVTIAARVYLLRHKVERSDPVTAARELAEAWFACAL